MTNCQSKRSHTPAPLQSGCRTALLLMLVSLLTLTASCAKDDNPSDDKPTITGIISSYNEFGAAMLDFTEADMTKAGFTLGDVVSISVAGNDIVMPYYDGYYTRNGEYLCVAYPTYPSICFTANNVGVPYELTRLEGQPVTITMHQKGGCLDVQQAMSMKYVNERDHYAESTDAQYANARAASGGSLASGVLHRSSSPFSNGSNRAFYVS